jgi:hypothetical protein
MRSSQPSLRRSLDPRYVDGAMSPLRTMLARTLRAWLACAALMLTFVPAPAHQAQARDVAVQLDAVRASARRATLPEVRDQSQSAPDVEPVLTASARSPGIAPDPSVQIEHGAPRYIRHCALLL